MTTSTIISQLEKCKIPTTPQNVLLAENLLKLENAYLNLNLISLPLNDLKELGISKPTKEAILEDYYKSKIPKTFDILESTLGGPTSEKMAYEKFLESKVDLGKVPQEQKKLINLQTNSYYDVIAMQQYTLDSKDLVQLKLSGEIMLKENFDSLVKNNKTIWCGKENVSFITPLTKTFMGTPTFFNLDPFYPQKPGTLFIKRIENVHKIKSRSNPLTVPEYFFRFTYSNYTDFYLPDTPDGRKVLFLYKDAFKKGNLFGFNEYGGLRRGRVHLKTTLEGTFGYPDNANVPYLERVTGELFDLGSSLYTYMHSHDKVFDWKADPFPNEKRFKIVVE